MKRKKNKSTVLGEVPVIGRCEPCDLTINLTKLASSERVGCPKCGGPIERWGFEITTHDSDSGQGGGR